MDTINNNRRITREYIHFHGKVVPGLKMENKKIKIVQIGVYGRFNEINRAIIYGMCTLCTVQSVHTDWYVRYAESQELRNSESDFCSVNTLNSNRIDPGILCPFVWDSLSLLVGYAKIEIALNNWNKRRWIAFDRKQIIDSIKMNVIHLKFADSLNGSGFRNENTIFGEGSIPIAVNIVDCYWLQNEIFNYVNSVQNQPNRLPFSAE